jgi:hypothetical protein
LEADPPFGGLEHVYRVQILRFTANGRLTFVTDGVLEREAAGLDVAALLASTGADHPREAVQHLLQAAVQPCNGAIAVDISLGALRYG